MPMVRIGEALSRWASSPRRSSTTRWQQQRSDRSVPLGELLVRSGLVSRADLQTALARKMGYPLVDVMQFPADTEALRAALRRGRALPALPLMMRAGRLVVALEDPSHRASASIDEIEFAAQCKVVPVLARAGTLLGAIDRAYEKIGAETGAPARSRRRRSTSRPTTPASCWPSLEQEQPRIDDATTTAIEQSDNSLVRLINSMILERTRRGCLRHPHRMPRRGARRCASASARTAVLRPTWSCRTPTAAR
jgi:hypothetical protein